MQGSSDNDNSTNLQKSLIESPLKVHLRVSEDHSESCDKENNTQTDSENDEIEELAGPVLMQSLKSMRWSVRKQLYSYSTWSHSRWMIGREQNPTFKGIMLEILSAHWGKRNADLKQKPRWWRNVEKAHTQVLYHIDRFSEAYYLPVASTAMFQSYFLKEKNPKDQNTQVTATPNILPDFTNDIPERTQALALSPIHLHPDPAPAHACIQSCTPHAMGPINGVTVALVPSLIPALGSWRQIS